jgi:hypothetical protein
MSSLRDKENDRWMARLLVDDDLDMEQSESATSEQQLARVLLDKDSETHSPNLAKSRVVLVASVFCVSRLQDRFDFLSL